MVGYWIYCQETTHVTIEGGLPGVETLAVAAGWNVIGFPVDGLLPDWAGVNGPAWTWDPASESYHPVFPGDAVRIGEAYWIYAAAAADLPLP